LPERWTGCDPIETVNELISTEIWNGRTLADLLTLEFLTSAAGSVLGAVAILFAGWIVSA
jgi:small conductance mechanosensitive channel